MSPRHLRRRRGISLVETAVAIAVGSTVLVTIAVTTHLFYRSGASLRQDAESRRSAAALIVQFRKDVHRAEAAATPTPDQLELTMADRTTVRYRLEDGDVDRQVDDGERILHLDSFSVRAEPESNWSVADAQVLFELRRFPSETPSSTTDPPLEEVRATLRLTHTPSEGEPLE